MLWKYSAQLCIKFDFIAFFLRNSLSRNFSSSGTYKLPWTVVIPVGPHNTRGYHLVCSFWIHPFFWDEFFITSLNSLSPLSSSRMYHFFLSIAVDHLTQPCHPNQPKIAASFNSPNSLSNSLSNHCNLLTSLLVSIFKSVLPLTAQSYDWVQK